MSTYRFIGSSAEIHSDEPIQLTDFGQAIEADEDLAGDWIAGGCAIIPDEDFQEIGFTAEELRKYKHPGARQGASVEFQEKFKQALLVLHYLREGEVAPPAIEREVHQQFPPD